MSHLTRAGGTPSVRLQRRARPAPSPESRRAFVAQAPATSSRTALAFEAFEPRAFVTDARSVVVKLRVAYLVRKTGRRVDEEQVQWWTFDDGGRITGLRHYEDTAAVQAAFRG